MLRQLVLPGTTWGRRGMTSEVVRREEGLELLRELFSEERLRLIPFTSGMGLRLEALEEDQASMRFDFADGVVGNPFGKTLQGGCIGAVLDQCAGMVAVTAFAMRDPHELTMERFAHMFAFVGTVDLRVDYLAPGRGSSFVASAVAIAVRNKIITTQMRLTNESDKLIAIGTGSFLVDPKPERKSIKE